MDLFSIFLSVIILAVVVIILIVISGKKGRKTSSTKVKDRASIIREANNRLAQDPHNPEGLQSIGDLYYREHLWEKAMPVYEMLMDIASAHPSVNQGEAALRYGVCAINLNKPNEALKGLVLAKKLMPSSFDVNFNLGQTFYLLKEYEKAIPLLRQAAVANPDEPAVQKFLGISLFKDHKYRESITYLKHALDTEPENKEVLFTMAECLSETGNNDRAIKIFSHLRPDPEFGARASLYAGIIHASSNQTDRAIEDFQLGLRHQNVPQDQLNELRYRLASCYLKTQDLGTALGYLQEIQAATPNYKDVSALISRYRELNQNKNLQIYLIANNSDFIALCRKIVMGFYRNSRVKISDIQAYSDHAEILTEIDTAKWEDTIIFRFYRSTGTIGELFIRDFHGKIRDAKAGRGICMTAGNFSEEAVKFAEGRPIDLIGKTKLNKILNTINTSGSHLK